MEILAIGSVLAFGSLMYINIRKARVEEVYGKSLVKSPGLWHQWWKGAIIINSLHLSEFPIIVSISLVSLLVILSPLFMLIPSLLIPTLVFDTVILALSIIFNYYWAVYQIYLYGDTNTLPTKKLKKPKVEVAAPIVAEFIQPTTQPAPAEISPPAVPKFKLMDDDEFVIEFD